MHRTAAALLALSSLFPLGVLSGCASAAGPSRDELAGASAPASCAPPLGAACAAIPCVPAFTPDGRLRRDVITDAPLFVAAHSSLASRAPRFNDDGSVCRDPESGALLYEDVAGGRVVRVLVVGR